MIQLAITVAIVCAYFKFKPEYYGNPVDNLTFLIIKPVVALALILIWLM